MHVVEKEGDAALCLGDLFAERAEFLRQRAPDACPGEELAHSNLDQDALVERPRRLAIGDALREPPHHARLADAGGADEAGVVAVALREDVEHLLDLHVTPHDGVELAARRRQREVRAEGRQGGETFGG